MIANLLRLAVLLILAAIVVAIWNDLVAHASERVIASIYWPGDGTVPKNFFGTSSGERYDARAMKCASIDHGLGERRYLSLGRNHAEVIINDRGPFVKGRKLDCTPAVNEALHLDGLGSVRDEPWPPLPTPRPSEATP